MDSNLCDDAKISTQDNSITTPTRDTQEGWTGNVTNGQNIHFPPYNTTEKNLMGPFNPGLFSIEDGNFVKPKLKETKSQGYSLCESVIPKKYQYNNVHNDGVAEFSELSLYPKKQNHRAEMLWLMKVTEKMLKEAGVDEEHLDVAIAKKGSQMEKFIYLINQEKDVYNRVFYEVIRQTSVQCRERGMLLGELRRRYASLLERVPTQVMGLHRELTTQRAMAHRAYDTFQAYKQATRGILSEMKKIIREIQTTRLGAMQLQNTPGNCQLYFSSEQREIEAEIMKLESDTNTWETETNTICLPEKIQYLEEILDHDNNRPTTLVSHMNDDRSIDIQKLDEHNVCMKDKENKSVLGLGLTGEEDSGYTALQLALSRLKRAEGRAAEAEEKVCALQLRLNLLENTGYSNDAET